MTVEEVLNIFEENDALLKGHFLLTSGLHSDRYLQCALVLQHPTVAERLGAELAAKAKPDPDIGGLDLVIAPALGGVIVAHEVARSLGVRALFTERQEKTMTLRRGFQIKPGERCLVVEDVVTTGGSTREVMEVVAQHGGVTAGAGSLIDRSLKRTGAWWTLASRGGRWPRSKSQPTLLKIARCVEKVRSRSNRAAGGDWRSAAPFICGMNRTHNLSLYPSLRHSIRFGRPPGEESDRQPDADDVHDYPSQHALQIPRE